MSPVNDVQKFKKNEKLEAEEYENQLRKMMSAELIKKIQARIESGDDNFMRTLKMVIDEQDQHNESDKEKK